MPQVSALGDISVVLAMLCVLYDGAQHRDLQLYTALPAFNWEKYPLSFGSVSFLFCVHFVMLPVEQSMRDPAKFRTAAAGAFFFCSVWSAVFGVLGLLYFGPHPQVLPCACPRLIPAPETQLTSVNNCRPQRIQGTGHGLFYTAANHLPPGGGPLNGGLLGGCRLTGNWIPPPTNHQPPKNHHLLGTKTLLDIRCEAREIPKGAVVCAHRSGTRIHVGGSKGKWWGGGGGGS